MPGGCKSILNVKCLHKSHIAELFGPRVFCFSVGQKKMFCTLKTPPLDFFDEIRFGDFFFDSPKNKKPSVQKVPLYAIYGEV